jgi:protein gp37
MGLSLWGKKAPRQITESPWRNVVRWSKEAGSTTGVLGTGPKLVFTGSLCDVFEDHPMVNDKRKDVFRVIREYPNLHFQLLTKRPENIERFLPADWGYGYSNVWLGTTIEDQRVAHRADILREIPARIRFISYEPAIGPLTLDLTNLHWVIYGGESGPGHRPENKQWARDMRSACANFGVAFFHKQSAGYRTELGIELDGEIVREFPAI